MRRAAAVAVAALVLAGCVGHSRTDEDYGRKATKTVEVAESSVRSAPISSSAAATNIRRVRLS